MTADTMTDEAAATRFIADWPDLAKLLELVTAELAARTEAPTVVAGGRSFRLVHPEGAERPALVVEDAAGTRTIVDAERDQITLDWWVPAPSGRHVAIGVSVGGDEQSVLHVLDDQGRRVGEPIPHCTFGQIAWLLDSTGLYICRGHAPDTADPQKYLHFYPLDDLRADRAGEELPPLGVVARPQVSADGRFVAVLTYPAVLTWRLAYLRDRGAGHTWIEVAAPGASQLSGSFVGQRYVAVSKQNASRGQILALDAEVAAAGEVAWTVIADESHAVALEVLPVNGGFVVHELVDATSRLKVLGPDGRVDRYIELPDNVTVADLAADELGLTFAVEGYAASAAGYRYRVDSGETSIVRPPRRTVEAVVRTTHATAPDGATVLVHLVHRPDLPTDRPQPTLMHVYGGFNHAWTPSYLGAWAPFVAAGGVYAHAHLRGGGEFGEGWWHDGRMARKQHTFDDAIAVATHLIATQMTTASLLAIAGSSNGGLTVAATLVQRPDLFGAAVAIVPVLDLLDTARDPFLRASVAMEYGDPTSDADLGVMRAYSPLQNIRLATDYPAVLVCCGENDMRCPAWQSRKFVARLQAENTGPNPVALRVWPQVGHGTGLTRTTEAMVAAEPVAFVMRALGMSVDSEGGGR